ncbi:MAG: VanZ family protein [Treponemataceae bacterium]|nr:VanZ family protein [Treponemataceae bacterium]
MIEITYGQMLVFITLAWIITRSLVLVKKARASWPEKNATKKNLLRELQLLMVYICLIVIARIVYFPWHHVDGHIGLLRLDPARILPLRLNLLPIVRLFEVYDGWQMNIIGNITMFIPVGLVWPLCFKKLDSIWKTILAGGGFSLFIEISQLLFYERSTDVDDLLLNTLGFTIGALIFFGSRKIVRRKVKPTEK